MTILETKLWIPDSHSERLTSSLLDVKKLLKVRTIHEKLVGVTSPWLRQRFQGKETKSKEIIIDITLYLMNPLS